MYKHQKQREHPWSPPSPLTPVLREQPAAGEAASGTRSCWSCPAVLETSLASGLYLEASSFSSLFFRTSSACLSWEGREGKGRVTPEGIKGGTREPKEWPPPEVKSRVSRSPEKGQKVAGETGRRQVSESAGVAPGGSLTGANLPGAHLKMTPVPTRLFLPHLAILGFALKMLLDFIEAAAQCSC